MAAADAVEDAPVFVTRSIMLILIFNFFLFGCFEVYDGVHKSPQEKFAPASPIISFSKFWVILNNIVKVHNRQLMVLHVLIHLAACEVNGFIFVYFLEHQRIALQGIMVLPSSVIHNSQMMLTAYEIWIEF